MARPASAWPLALLGAGVAYFAIGAALHFLVFPEPEPPADDRPQSGSEVRLPGGSSFVYRRTAAETDGEVFEAEWRGQPGADIPRHTHPSQAVRIAVLEGAVQVEIDDEVHLLAPGEVAEIPAGSAHRWANVSDEVARAIFELRPAGRADFVFVQLDRAFGGEASALATALQTFVLIGTHGEHTAWPIETLRFLLAPSARLFGVRSYYPPTPSRR